MNDCFEDELENRAFHEAGHVAVAEKFSIPVRQVSIVTIEGQPPGARLAPLREICKLSSASHATRRRVEDYATARLAGPVVEMTNAALRASRRNQTVEWEGWQADWKELLIEQNDVDLDFAFAIAFGWSSCEDEDLLHHVDHLWKRALRIVRAKQTWRRIRRLATSLLELDVMTGDEATAVLRDG